MRQIKKINTKIKIRIENTDKVLFLVFFLAMLVRLIYVIGTGKGQRQHDVHSFDDLDGHAGYIMYLLKNARLFDFDPREYFQFYHPPFHHIISALWVKLNLLIGFNLDTATENIQILTFIYSGLFLFWLKKTLKIIGLSGRGLLLTFTLVAFFPKFIILSGSINNDMLSIALMQGAIYYALSWAGTLKTRDILLAGLFIGLGMMTKLSVAIAAFGIAFIFLYKFIGQIMKKNSEKRLRKISEKKLRKMLGDFLAFGLISFPLGLWWPIRNKLLFDLPLNYVPSLGDSSHQYIGSYSIYDRLFNFSFYQFKNIFVAWGPPDTDYFEHNIFIGLFKTGLFGEQTSSHPGEFTYLIALLLFYSGLLVLLAGFIWNVYGLFKMKREDRLVNIFLTITGIVVLFSYIQFSFLFPHTCTQNIRYATPLIWIFYVAIGRGVSGTQNTDSGRAGKVVILTHKIFVPATYFISIFFACMSALYYIIVVIKPGG